MMMHGLDNDIEAHDAGIHTIGSECIFGVGLEVDVNCIVFGM